LAISICSVAVCALQCVAVCPRGLRWRFQSVVLQCVKESLIGDFKVSSRISVAGYCRVLQCAAGCCRVLQCVAVCCSVFVVATMSRLFHM